jgi:hypothetical protein
VSDPNTVRILQLDGGGARGYMSLCFLKDFVDLWGIDNTTIASHFDVVCGTSAGGIASLMIAAGLTPDEMLDFFVTDVPYVFSLSSLIPSLRPNLAAKLALVLTNTPIYQSSGPTAPDYGHGKLVSRLQSIFGSTTMQQLNSSVVIPVYELDTSTYKIFSNLNYPEFEGQNLLVSDVALATSAAPVYFPSWPIGDHTYIDGGVYNNNIAQIGKFTAQSLKPNANRSCVLSIGTGIGEMGFDTVPGLLKKAFINKTLEMTPESSIELLFALFDIAQAGGQESTAFGLGLEAKYVNSQSYHYRFQKQLELDLDTELDNTDSDILVYYQSTEQTIFESDINNLTTFLGHLTA